MQRPCELLRRHGFVIVKLPPEIIKAARKAAVEMRRFFAGSNQQKARYRTPQEGEKVLSHPGYLTPSPGWAELFEVRRSKRDPQYRFPAGCEDVCMHLFDELRALSLYWLAVLSRHLTGDGETLPALACRDSGPATLRVIHYDQVPDLAAELAGLGACDASRRRDAERTIMAGFPAHTDSSLLTLAPRASTSGLAVRDYASGKWLRIERTMAEDEAVLFAGDPLAFASRHYWPACMHRPDGMEMVRSAPSTRLSTPFFLYPDSEGVLDSTLTHASLRTIEGLPLPAPIPATLSVRDFQANLDGCREKWPWKKGSYYAGLVLARDSDHFPGLGSEGDMVYGDK